MNLGHGTGLNEVQGNRAVSFAEASGILRDHMLNQGVLVCWYHPVPDRTKDRQATRVKPNDIKKTFSASFTF